MLMLIDSDNAAHAMPCHATPCHATAKPALVCLSSPKLHAKASLDARRGGLDVHASRARGRKVAAERDLGRLWLSSADLRMLHRLLPRPAGQPRPSSARDDLVCDDDDNIKNLKNVSGEPCRRPEPAAIRPSLQSHLPSRRACKPPESELD